MFLVNAHAMLFRPSVSFPVEIKDVDKEATMRPLIITSLWVEKNYPIFFPTQLSNSWGWLTKLWDTCV